MSGNHAAVTKSITQQLEIGLLEQRFGGAFWVGAVGDDNVELALAGLEKLEAVADVHLDVGVLEADAHAGEILLGHANDGLLRLSTKVERKTAEKKRHNYFVNVAENSLLDALMLDNLAQNTAVSAANDKHFFGVRVRVHRQMGDHLLVAVVPHFSA